MKICVPEDLRFFAASHRKYGKCQIEFSAFTGTVVSKEERTTTRVYGDSRGVGSTVSVDQALWIQLEDGSEQRIDIQDDTPIARPRHSITCLNAKNPQIKNSLYVAFLNHSTKEFYYFQYGLWARLLWGDKRSGFLHVLGLGFFISLFLGIVIALLIGSMIVEVGFITIVVFATGGFMIPIGIPLSLVYHSGFVWNSANKVRDRFKKQINQIMGSFREQLGQGS